MFTFFGYIVVMGIAAAIADKYLPPDDADHDYNGAYPPRNLCIGVISAAWLLALPVAIGYLSFRVTKQCLSR
jgi:hypothetical protein